MQPGLIIDSFAGGGGASTGIKMALGRSPDVAINHDAEAVAMHLANHPETTHYCRNIWQADPCEVVRQAGGGPVALAWFSPDCKHFSKAKGGRPVKRSIRDLAWVVVQWARRVRPRVIALENVEEFADWGPVTRKGQPCQRRRGNTFARWVADLERLGYVVEWRVLKACDYGAPTIRKRLFVVARCDGAPITWPAPTHGPGLEPYRTAAEIIDWSIPCPSIFMDPAEARALGLKRPLADATLARIARGVQRYVLEAADPFVMYLQQGGATRSIEDPLHTVTASIKDCNLVVQPTLTRTGDSRAIDRTDQVTAFMAQHNGGMVGHDARKPVSTIVQRGTTQALVTSNLVKLKGTCRDGQPVTEPLHTIQAGGLHYGEVRAFLMKYYRDGGQWQGCDEPVHTMTTKARLGLVTVAGTEYAIADIGMRMLTPRELFRAQGFADDYIINPEVDGKPLTKTAQVRMCGNSVCPQVAAAVVRANLVDQDLLAIPEFLRRAA